jgi:hypothetical protein
MMERQDRNLIYMAILGRWRRSNISAHLLGTGMSFTFKYRKN